MPLPTKAYGTVASEKSGANTADVHRDPRVDAVIEQAAEFAQPVLRHMRDLVHAAMPDVREEIKWGRPFFLLGNDPVCMMAAFKTYCAFGFWSPNMVPYLKQHGIDAPGTAGNVGRITSVQDVPRDLKMFVQHAASLVASGSAGSAMQGNMGKSRKAEIPMPTEFEKAMQRSAAAAATFNGFPPSCRREYLEWIAGAKKPETREKRISQAITMLETGRRFKSATPLERIPM